MAEYDDIIARMTGNRFAGQGSAGMSLPMLPQGFGRGTTPALPYFSGLGAQQGPLPPMGFQPAGMQMMNRPPSFPYGAEKQPLAPMNFDALPRSQAFGPEPTPRTPMGKDASRLPYEEPPQEAARETKGGRLDRQPEEEPQAQGLRGFITPEMRAVLVDLTRRDPSLMNDPHRMGIIMTKIMPFMHKRQQEQYAAARQAHTERMEVLANERAARAERLEQYKYLHDRESYITRRMDKAWDRIKTLSDPLTEFAGDKKAELAKQQGYLKTYEEQLQSIVNDSHQARKEVFAGPGESVQGKGTQGKPGETGLTAPTDKGPPQIFQLQADDIDNFVEKVKPALLKAKTLAEKELIIRNTFDHINKQLQKDGKSPLSLPDANKLLIRLGRDAYDPRSTGQKVNDWVSDSIKSWFPDYEQSDSVMGDLGFAARFYGNLVNPAEYENMLVEGMQTALDTRPTTEQMLTDRARSGPERLLGAAEAAGGLLGPVGMALAPGASALGANVGALTSEATDNPWLGMLAGGLAGGGAGALGRGAVAPRGMMPPSGPPRLGGSPTAPRIPYFPPDVAGGMSRGAPPIDPMRGMMGGSPGPAGPGAAAMKQATPGAFPTFGEPGTTPGMQGPAPMGPQSPFPFNPNMVGPAPAGTPRLPPPGAGPMRSNVGPLPGRVTGAGPTVRPKAGLYGRQPAQGEQRPIEMPDPSIRMGGPGEQLRLPPPTRAPEPVDPISRSEAAAEVAAGKEPAPPVEKPSRLQRDVTQFGDHVVGDTVKFNGRTRKIEALIPAAPGNMAPKAKLSGLKMPVSLTALEPVSAAKAAKFAEGDRVKWDLPAGFGTVTGTVQKITTSAKGRAMATVKRSDGQVVDVAVDSLQSV